MGLDDTKHLTDLEAILYWEKELNDEAMLEANAHIKGCESCRKAVIEAHTFSELVYGVVGDGFPNERRKDCLSEMHISAYLERHVTQAEKIRIEGHLSGCNYCLSLLVETGASLKEGVKDEEPQFSYEKVMDVVKQQLREIRGLALSDKFAMISKKSPLRVQNALKSITNDIELTFKKTFVFPTPRFSPVFGNLQITSLSPYGKVRYPIMFEWIPYEGADRYIISLEGTELSFATEETKVQLKPEEMKLDYGKEYTWELKAVSGKRVIHEIAGCFSIAGEDEIREINEIEQQIQNIEPEQDRLMVWGLILEQKQFYMAAIEQYKEAYRIKPLGGVAYRTAFCYDKLELEELRDEWNRKIEQID